MICVALGQRTLMANSLPVSWNVPEELKKDIRKHVGYLIKLCPGWVQKLTVEYTTSIPYGEHCRASTTCDYRYRNVHLNIYPAWIWLNEQDKKTTIVHEACHILVAPIQQFIEDMVESYLPNNKENKDFAHAMWDVAHEASVEDMAHAFIDSGGWGEVTIDEDGSTGEDTTVKPFIEKEDDHNS